MRETAVPVFYCATALGLLFLLIEAFDRIAKFVQSRASPLLVVSYLGSQLATAVEFLLPSAVTFGLLYALWQMARNNELTAMRTSGVSLIRIMIPPLVLGLACSLVAAAIREWIVPRASPWAMEVARNQFRTANPDRWLSNIAYYNPIDGRQWLIGRVNALAPNVLEQVRVDEEEQPGRPRRILMAVRACYLDGTWWLFGVQETRYTVGGVPLNRGRPMPPEPDPEQAIEFSDWRETPSAFAAALIPRCYLSARSVREYLDTHPSLSRAERNVWRTELHERLALPFACLVVVLFAIPVGAQAGRQSALRGVFFALGGFVAYYALFQVGLLLGRRGTVSPWVGAWLANMCFAASGAAVLVRSR
jgi:lipopolysaccharide export system permease protein